MLRRESLRRAVLPPRNGRQGHAGKRRRPTGFPKQAVLRCETGRFASQNGLFQASKRPVLQRIGYQEVTASGIFQPAKGLLVASCQKPPCAAKSGYMQPESYIYALRHRAERCLEATLPPCKRMACVIHFRHARCLFSNILCLYLHPHCNLPNNLSTLL